MAELNQLVNILKVQLAAEMADLKLSNAIQIIELHRIPSADRIQPQGGQFLSGTDPVFQ